MEGEKKPFNQEDIPAIMIVLGFGAMIFSTFLSYLTGSVSFILFVIALFSVIIGFILIMMEKGNDKAACISNINGFQREYNEYTEKLGIVKSNMQVTLFESGEYDFREKIPYYIWDVNGYIKFFPMAQYYINNRISSMEKPDISELKLKSISIDSILYFGEVGELYRYKKIYRAKNTWKTYVFGEAVADGSGEIIGVREPIKTSIEIKDDRKVKLFYKNEENSIVNLEFTYDAYEILKRLIPQKELRDDG